MTSKKNITTRILFKNEYLFVSLQSNILIMHTEQLIDIYENKEIRSNSFNNVKN